jgi:hypothetical protein
MDLYIHSPIRLHGVVLKLVKHRDNFTFTFTLVRVYYNITFRKWIVFPPSGKQDTVDKNKFIVLGSSVHLPQTVISLLSGPIQQVLFRVLFI